MSSYQLNTDTVKKSRKHKDLESLPQIAVMESVLPRGKYYLVGTSREVAIYFADLKDGIYTEEKVRSAFSLICSNKEK